MASLAFAASSKGDHGGHKASFRLGPFKVVFGSLTFDTDYPDDGYTEAALLALTGLSPYMTRDIVAIIPLSPAVSGSGETANVLGWSSLTSTLKAYEGGADGDPMDELPTGDNILDGATADVIIIGR